MVPSLRTWSGDMQCSISDVDKSVIPKQYCFFLCLVGGGGGKKNQEIVSFDSVYFVLCIEIWLLIIMWIYEHLLNIMVFNDIITSTKSKHIHKIWLYVIRALVDIHRNEITISDKLVFLQGCFQDYKIILHDMQFVNIYIFISWFYLQY